MELYKQQFLEYLKNEKKVSGNTYLSYEGDISSFFKFVNKINIGADRINKTNIMAYIYELEQSGKKSSTVSRNLASIRAFYSYLFVKGFVSANPAEAITPPRVEKKAPEILSVNEVEKLLAQPSNDEKGTRDRAMLEVLYATGMRVSELIALKMSDVNLQMGYVKCAADGKERVVPLGSKAVSAVMNYLSRARNSMVGESGENIFFVNYSGRPMTRQGFWKIIKSYAEQANISISVTPHCLRHSFAAHMVANGADLSSIQEMLGHTELSTTKIYAQFSNNRLKDVYLKTHPRA